jgi:hypothetical protein
MTILLTILNKEPARQQSAGFFHVSDQNMSAVPHSTSLISRTAQGFNFAPQIKLQDIVTKLEDQKQPDKGKTGSEWNAQPGKEFFLLSQKNSVSTIHWWHCDMGFDPRGTEGLVFSEVRYYSDGPLVGPGWVVSPRGLRWRLGESRITARRPNVSTRVKGHL